MELNAKLTVTITLSEQLFRLIENRVPAIERRVNKAVDKEIGKKVREESKATVKVEAVKAEPTPEPEAAPKAEPEPAPKAAAGLTPGERIRLAMHKARQRIEGEDYKENTASELYQKYHKQMHSMFKQIASLLGADKPTALPDDKAEAFEAECERITIGDDGNVSLGKAPF